MRGVWHSCWTTKIWCFTETDELAKGSISESWSPVCSLETRGRTCSGEMRTKLKFMVYMQNAVCERKHTTHYAEWATHTMKCGGGSIMLERSFSSAGTAKLNRVNGRKNGAKYTALLEENLTEGTKIFRQTQKLTWQEGNYLLNASIMRERICLRLIH